MVRSVPPLNCIVAWVLQRLICEAETELDLDNELACSKASEIVKVRLGPALALDGMRTFV